VIARMIEDVIGESRRRLGTLAPACADDVRQAGSPVIAFSPAMAEADAAIKSFLFTHMYRHPRIARIMTDAEDVVADLFRRFVDDPAALPRDWGHRRIADDPAGHARRVADFIAGMTDRYALVEHARHFDRTPELM